MSNQPILDSVVINDLSSQKSTTTLLNSSQQKYQHHLYNYWTLNDRLRSKNEKLSRRQQTACRLAFYSLWLFVFSGVMAIVVYRFTEDCPLNSNNINDQRPIIIRCLRYLLLILAFSLSFLSCTGLLYGACRYFRSQPQPYLQKDRQELHLTHNYDLSRLANSNHPCCCQRQLSNGASVLSSPTLSNPTDENSNHTINSSLANISPHRKIPPFTYDELPPTHSKSSGILPISSSSIVADAPINSKNRKTNKAALFSSSTSTSSSPPSVLSTPLTSNTLPTTHPNIQANLTFDEASSHRPISYTTCTCAIDVWERQTKPSTVSSSR